MPDNNNVIQTALEVLRDVTIATLQQNAQLASMIAGQRLEGPRGSSILMPSLSPIPNTPRLDDDLVDQGIPSPLPHEPDSPGPGGGSDPIQTWVPTLGGPPGVEVAPSRPVGVTKPHPYAGEVPVESLPLED